MARPGFYNDNANRRYPLLPETPYDLAVYENVDSTGTQLSDIELPDSVVLDFGCLFGLDAEFVDAQDTYWLAYILRTGDELTIAFRSDAAGLTDWELQFQRDWTRDGEYVISDAEAVYVGDSPETPFPACDPAARWTGFLATGDLSVVGAAISDGFYGIPTVTAVVEPTLSQNLRASFVRTVNLANFDRTRAEAPDGCSLSAQAANPEVWVGETCMGGSLLLRAGYNCRIRQDTRTNTLEISASVGAGAGVPCEEVPLGPDESSISGELLTGGPFCREVLKTINGVGGRVIRVEGGDGVRVASVPAENRLVVDVDLHNLQVCVPATSQSSSASA